MPEPLRSDHHFASDNTAGICPEAWAALQRANVGREPSYGADGWTQRATELIRGVFERPDAEVFFVFNGTAANALALASACESYHGIVGHEIAHIMVDECGAPGFFTGGATLLPCPGARAKLEPVAVERVLTRRSDLHFPKPRVLSLTQSTEWGTAYRPAEIAALSALARRHGLVVHMDGARFANAAAALAGEGATPADLTWRAGVDVLCFGGTKNGLNSTEALVFFNPELARDFAWRGKQAGQLASKMRFATAQWVGMLENGAWLRHAAHANRMAGRLADLLRAIPGVSLCLEPEVNAVFVRLAKTVAAELEARGWHFHAFIGDDGYRLMCSWDTRDEDLQALVQDLREVLSASS